MENEKAKAFALKLMELIPEEINKDFVNRGNLLLYIYSLIKDFVRDFKGAADIFEYVSYFDYDFCQAVTLGLGRKYENYPDVCAEVGESLKIFMQENGMSDEPE